MNEDQLREIENVIDGEDHPGDVWFLDTIEMLIKEIRRLRHEHQKKKQGLRS